MTDSKRTGSDRPTKALSRRALIAGAAASGVTWLHAADGRAVQVGAPAGGSEQSLDPTKRQGPPPRPLGTRSRFENPRRQPSSASSRTPLQDLYGTITPSDLHFERHHAGIPDIDPARHELVIHGLVERPTSFSVADLKRFPSLTRTCFLECSGNFGGRREEVTPQQVCGLTSQSEWTGVALSTLFREVGVRDGAAWFLAEGSDAAVMARSVPMTKGLDDAILAYAQNGEALRPAQGYPVRLLLPGWEGNASVKWLRRIEVADRPFMTRDETARYTERISDGTIRQFSFVMDARSIITFPAYPNVIEPGWVEVRGLAWSGRGRVSRVDVSTDGGRTWAPAELQEPVLAKAHTRFRHLWEWDGRPTELLSRVADDTGYTQPTMEQLLEARGAPSYHFNPVTAWAVGRDGAVRFRVDLG